MNFIFLVILMTCSFVKSDEDDQKYIDLLPESEKQAFLDSIVRRLFNEVKVKDTDTRTSVEIPEGKLDEHEDFVKLVLAQETSNLRRNDDDKQDVNESTAKTVGENKFDKSDESASAHIDLTLRSGQRVRRNSVTEKSAEHKADEIPVQVIYENSTDSAKTDIIDSKKNITKQELSGEISDAGDIQVKGLRKSNNSKSIARAHTIITDYDPDETTEKIKGKDESDSNEGIPKHGSHVSGVTVSIYDEQQSQEVLSDSDTNEDTTMSSPPTTTSEFITTESTKIEVTNTTVENTTPSLTTITLPIKNNTDNVTTANQRHFVRSADNNIDNDTKNATLNDSTLVNIKVFSESKINDKSSSDKVIINVQNITEIPLENISKIPTNETPIGRSGINDGIIETTTEKNSDKTNDEILNDSSVVNIKVSSESKIDNKSDSNEDTKNRQNKTESHITNISSIASNEKPIGRSGNNQNIFEKNSNKAIDEKPDAIVESVTTTKLPTVTMHPGLETMASTVYKALDDLMSSNKTNSNITETESREVKVFKNVVKAVRSGLKFKFEDEDEDSNRNMPFKSSLDDLKPLVPSKTYEVFEIPADQAPFVQKTGKSNKEKGNVKKGKRKDSRKNTNTEKRALRENKEQPYVVPVYNYAPEQAYYNSHNRLGPNYDNSVEEWENVDFLRQEGKRSKRLPRKQDNDKRQFRFGDREKKTKHTARMPKPQRPKLSLIVKEPKYTNNYVSPKENVDIDYYFGRSRDMRTDSSKLNVVYKKIGYLPDSDDEDHVYNVMKKGKTAKSHAQAVRQSLHGRHVFHHLIGFKTTEKPMEVEQYLLRAKMPLEKKIPSKYRYFEKDSGPDNEISIDYYLGLDDKPKQRKKMKAADQSPFVQETKKGNKRKGDRKKHNTEIQALRENEEQPYVVPVYNYAPEQAYYNSHNKLGPNYDKSGEEWENKDFLRVDKSNKQQRNQDSDKKHFKFGDRVKKTKHAARISKPQRTSFNKKHFNPNDNVDMDYYFGRSRITRTNNSKLNEVYKTIGILPDSDDEDHVYNAMKKGVAKSHTQAVRQWLHGRHIFQHSVGFKTTEKPMEVEEYFLRAKIPLKKKRALKFRYSERNSEPDNEISIDYYFGLDDEPEQRKKIEGRKIFKLEDFHAREGDFEEEEEEEEMGPPPKRKQETIKDLMSIYPPDAFLHIDDLLNLNIPVARSINEDLSPHLMVLKDMVHINNDALVKFDWLKTTVDIQAAIEKLDDLIEALLDEKDLHPSDLQLIKYIQYLYETSKASNDEALMKFRTSKTASDAPKKKKFALPRNKNKKKGYLNGKGVLTSSRVWLYRAQDMEKLKKHKRLLELQKFLENVRLSLFDLHNAVNSIASVTTYRNQRWFQNLKELYLTHLENKQLLEILVHLTLTRLLDLIEEASKNGVENSYALYKERNEKDVMNTVNEFRFLLDLLNELKLIK